VARAIEYDFVRSSDPFRNLTGNATKGLYLFRGFCTLPLEPGRRAARESRQTKGQAMPSEQAAYRLASSRAIAIAQNGFNVGAV
jgi:hypothetical protein